MKNSLRVSAGNKGQRDYAATIVMGKASLALGRNEFGSTGNMTESLGTKKINGTAVPYYIGFGDSKKDHLAFNYKFDDRFKFSYMFNKKKYTTNYNDVNENILQHFSINIFFIHYQFKIRKFKGSLCFRTFFSDSIYHNSYSFWFGSNSKCF